MLTVLIFAPKHVIQDVVEHDAVDFDLKPLPVVLYHLYHVADPVVLGLFGPQPLFGNFVCNGALGRFV